MQQERRRATDEQMGYITGKIEEYSKHIEAIAVKLDKLEDKVSEKFTTVETTFKVLKFVGLAVVALLTFKFGDIAVIWHSLFG